MLEFFARETRRRFREEEERLFPLLVGEDDTAVGMLAQALLEHQQLRALAGALQADLAAGDVSPAAMSDLARALEQHIRFEERTLFPLIENLASEDALRRLQGTPDTSPAVDTLSPEGTGPLWGTETDDLNATLLAWPPGGGQSEHVTLLVVLAGSATVTVDGEARAIDAGQVITIAKGSVRRLAAGPQGVRYLSVHTRRPPLQISARQARLAAGRSSPRRSAGERLSLRLRRSPVAGRRDVGVPQPQMLPGARPGRRRRRA